MNTEKFFIKAAYCCLFFYILISFTNCDKDKDGVLICKPTFIWDNMPSEDSLFIDEFKTFPRLIRIGVEFKNESNKSLFIPFKKDETDSVFKSEIQIKLEGINENFVKNIFFSDGKIEGENIVLPHDEREICVNLDKSLIIKHKMDKIPLKKLLTNMSITYNKDSSDFHLSGFQHADIILVKNDSIKYFINKKVNRENLCRPFPI